MSAFEAPHDIAVRALHAMRLYGGVIKPGAAVDAVFDELAEPDRGMIAAGLREIGDCLSRHGATSATVEAIWLAMLERARR